jgi:hypothetical protein
MTQPNEIADDLRFVRTAVERRDQQAKPQAWRLIIWTMYSLVCIPTYDFLPRYGFAINMGGMVVCFVLSAIFGKRASKQSGQYRRDEIARTMLHWYVGILLLFLTCIGLSVVDPKIGEVGIGQISVILVGFLYFTAGVHLPEVRFMRWAGPIVVLAGIGIGLIPNYRWTVMGLIFAFCLMTPYFFSRRPANGMQP